METYNKETNHMETQNKIEVMQAYMRGEIIEACSMYDDPFDDASWMIAENPKWNFLNRRYRVRPEVITYDTMDWTNVDEKYQYAARDKSGVVFLFTTKPTASEPIWYNHNAYEAYLVLPSFFTGHKVGNCDWKDSLIKRDVKDWTKIDRFLHAGQKIAAIKEYREQGGRENDYLIIGLREAKYAVEARQKYLRLS